MDGFAPLSHINPPTASAGAGFGAHASPQSTQQLLTHSLQNLTMAARATSASFESMVMAQLSFSPQSSSYHSTQVNTGAVPMNALAQLFLPMAVQGAPSGQQQGSKQRRQQKPKDTSPTSGNSDSSKAPAVL